MDLATVFLLNILSSNKILNIHENSSIGFKSIIPPCHKISLPLFHQRKLILSPSYSRIPRHFPHHPSRRNKRSIIRKKIKLNKKSSHNFKRQINLFFNNIANRLILLMSNLNPHPIIDSLFKPPRPVNILLNLL